MRDIGDDVGNLPDHFTGVAVLAQIAVDPGTDGQVIGIIDVVGGHETRAHGAEAVEALSEQAVAFLAFLLADVAGGDVVGDHVSRHHVEGLVCRDILAPLADDEGHFGFVIHLLAARGPDDIVAGAGYGRCALQPTGGKREGLGRIAHLLVMGLIIAPGGDNLGRCQGREQMDVGEGQEQFFVVHAPGIGFVPVQLRQPGRGSGGGIHGGRPRAQKRGGLGGNAQRGDLLGLEVSLSVKQEGVSRPCVGNGIAFENNAEAAGLGPFSLGPVTHQFHAALPCTWILICRQLNANGCLTKGVALTSPLNSVTLTLDAGREG